MKKYITFLFLFVHFYTFAWAQVNPTVYYKKGDVKHLNNIEVKSGDKIQTGVKLNTNSLILLTNKTNISQIDKPGTYSRETIINLLNKKEDIGKEYLKYLSNEMFSGDDTESSQNILGAVSRASYAQNIFPPDSTQLLNGSVLFIWQSTGVEYYTFYLFDSVKNYLTSYLTTDTTFYLSNVSYELTAGNYHWCIGELQMPIDNLPKSIFRVLSNTEASLFNNEIKAYKSGIWNTENGAELELFYYSIHKLFMQRYWAYALDDNLSNEEIIENTVSF